MRVSLSRGAVRRAVLVPVGLLVALLLAGCFSITSQSTSQADGVGDLIVTTEMCALNPFPVAPCEQGYTQDASGDAQHFVAYLVDDWVQAPASVGWSGTLGSFPMARSDAFAAAVSSKLAPGAGKRWIGYASGRTPKLLKETDYRMTAVARLGIPEGSPTRASLATVTGWRLVRDAAEGVTALPVDRPINCDETDPDGSGPSAITTACAASSLPGTQPDATTYPATTTSVELSTLKLTAPAVLEATPGSVATLAFAVQAHRAVGGPESVPAAASSTLSGATVTAPASIALEGSDAASVQVRVPADATPGDYPVKLDAASGVRSATATLRVKAAPAAASSAPVATPTPTASPRLRTLQQSVDELVALLKVQAKVDGIRRSNVFDLPIVAPSAGTLSVSLTRVVRVGGKRRTQVLAKGSRVAKAAGPVVVKLVPTKAGARMLKAKGRYTGTLRVTLGGGGGAGAAAGVQKAKPVSVKFG